MPSEWAFTYTKSLKLAYRLTLLVYCVADVAHLSYGDIPACLYEAIPFILVWLDDSSGKQTSFEGGGAKKLKTMTQHSFSR